MRPVYSMKHIVTTLTLGLTLGLTLAISCHGEALENRPTVGEDTKAALNYLNLLSKGDIDIVKHTALSPHCGIQRRKAIRERIDLLTKSYFRDGDQFLLETKKTKGDFAAILFRSENAAAPLSTRIHALAMVKTAGIWKAAPLPGSFTNTGYGYDDKVEAIVRDLEHWMAREKITRQTQSRDKAITELKSTIAAIEKKLNLDTASPEKTALHLIEQSRDKNLFGILACMGAASDQLIDPLNVTMDLLSKGLTNKDESNDWYLLTSRSVIAQVLKIDNTRNEVAIGFYNPMERGKSKILYFPIHKSGDKTFTRLSPLLKVSLLPNNERWNHRWKHRRPDEDELRKKLPSTILKNSEPLSYPSTQKLLEHFISSLKKNDFTDSIRLLPRKGDYFGKDENQTATLFNFGSLWKEIHQYETHPSDDFQILENQSLALAPLQYAKLNRTGEYQTIKIWMVKDADGWHMLGQNPLDKKITDELTTSAKKLSEQFSAIEKKQQEKHSQNLLNQVVTITPPITIDPVKDEDAKKLFASFRNHLRSKDTESALSCCAVIKGTSRTQTLKTFNYALRGAADHTPDDHILGVIRAGKWLGISARTRSKLLALDDYPLYLVINTKMGPRVLLDIDLRKATNKGRQLLNKKNWKKLEDSLPEESLKNIKTMFAKHSELTEADIEATLKLHQ